MKNLLQIILIYWLILLADFLLYLLDKKSYKKNRKQSKMVFKVSAISILNNEF